MEEQIVVQAIQAALKLTLKSINHKDDKDEQDTGKQFAENYAAIIKAINENLIQQPSKPAKSSSPFGHVKATLQQPDSSQDA